jgi:hypothetical protein
MLQADRKLILQLSSSALHARSIHTTEKIKVYYGLEWNEMNCLYVYEGIL